MRCFALLALLFSLSCRPSSSLKSAVPDGERTFGSHLLRFSSGGLTVLQGDATVFSTPPNQAFVVASRVNRRIEESRGSFAFSESSIDTCRAQTVEQIDSPDTETIRLLGSVDCQGGQQKRWSMTLSSRNASVRFEARLLEPSPESPYGVTFRVAQQGHDVFGLGEQFTFVNLRGRRVRSLTQEQGIGRGEQPITLGANLTAKSGGDVLTTYLPANRFFTETGFSVSLENTDVVTFDFSQSSAVDIEATEGLLTGRLLKAENLTEAVAATSPAMRPLPDWIRQGAILGLQGGTEKVEAIVKTMAEAGVPIAAVWLQDWVGQRITTFGKQLWWNWELDRDRYPDWEGLLARLKAQNIRVLTYVNPFLVDVDGVKPNALRNLFREAKERKFLVQTESGEPYLIPNTSFSAGLVDLTNPAAVSWFESVLTQQVLGVGASGWMADFGEALPFDAKLSKGSAIFEHNQYPVRWAQLNRQVVDASKAVAPSELVFFMRAGFTESPRYATLFWAGDQMVSWSEFDGLKSAVVGVVSGGFSGFSLNHSDIGGYTGINNIIGNYQRSRELLLRWMEFAALTPVFRTHEGNLPDSNAQAYSDSVTIAQFRKMARLYVNLADYRKTLEGQAPLPLVRHPALQYPNEATAREIRFETFLLGPDVLMAPVTDPATNRVNVYFPPEEWVHLWSGEVVDARAKARFETWNAPIGEPAIFIRKGASWAGRLKEGL